MAKEKLLTEDRQRLVDEKINEAIQILTLNRTPIEDTVLALPVNPIESNSIQISSGIATSIVIFVNIMIIFKNL